MRGGNEVFDEHLCAKYIQTYNLNSLMVTELSEQNNYDTCKL